MLEEGLEIGRRLGLNGGVERMKIVAFGKAERELGLGFWEQKFSSQRSQTPWKEMELGTQPKMGFL